MRCVGNQGSGHGKYSGSVLITTPGNRESVSKPASVMSEASSSATGDGRLTLGQSSSKGRRGSFPSAEADSLAPQASNERVRKIWKGGKAGQ